MQVFRYGYHKFKLQRGHWTIEHFQIYCYFFLEFLCKAMCKKMTKNKRQHKKYDVLLFLDSSFRFEMKALNQRSVHLCTWAS